MDTAAALSALSNMSPAMLESALSSFDPLKPPMEVAQRLKSGANPAMLDAGVEPECIACKQHIKGKVLRCSQCKGVTYCSAPCSKNSWNGTPGKPLTSHKYWCAHNKRHMERLPTTQAMLSQYPWGRQESDGSFNDDLARARYDVLGVANMGFWSVRASNVPHVNRGAEVGAQNPMHTLMQTVYAKFNYTDGTVLLKNKHLSDAEGWKMKKTLIPFRDFALSGTKPPKELKEVLGSWKAWHDWRGLPMESLAPLLMSYPLTVYWLLVNTLKITSPTVGSSDNRVAVHVHLLGAEVELNYLPIFSELALLLPFHDIKLVMFGDCVRTIVSEGKDKPGSLAGLASPSTPVFSYAAPKPSGSGRIEIFLHGSTSLWDENDACSTYGKPNAIVALNGGLGSYAEWIPVVRAAHAERIPFGATDYLEQSAEHSVESIGGFSTSIHISMLRPAPMEKPMERREREKYEVDLNPFARPGQRQIAPVKLPNLVNGFTIAVWKED
ncbi:hypothetical protein CYLTODRAFT_404366 [Cylindrobasidium torrendii FP15055 ss-10]|uniref:MYND-type domain-containing protein n=1 Tax=Cylindrobasidium torrendii FP15055 ss-10 TaxID=1314674 RepID=A0A0D7AZ54_9AGAR|nr:hypothetical protein CYLTODRAFT_404366 [Cylindrobasidium torrendii FP15055 ss-10]